MVGLMGACCGCCGDFKDYSFSFNRSYFLDMSFDVINEGFRYGGTDFFTTGKVCIPFFSYHPYKNWEYLSALNIVGSYNTHIERDITKYRYISKEKYVDDYLLLNLVCLVDSSVLSFFDKCNEHFYNTLKSIQDTCFRFSLDEMNYWNPEFYDYVKSYNRNYSYNFDIKFRLFYDAETLYFKKIEMLKPSIATINFTKK